MKVYQNRRAKKLLVRFDTELREMLLNDLMRFSFKKPVQYVNNQAIASSPIPVA